MNTRSKIEEPVAKEFQQFNDEFANSLKSETRRLQSAIIQIQHAVGKHVRPLLVLLTAKACGKITEHTINAAVLLELLHTATLIHDDVIDETKERRGLPSLNAIFDNRVSVLVGDYILSSALIRAIQTRNLQIISIVSNLGRDLSEGEIKQLETAEESIVDEEAYMQVIKKKTATLLSACTEIGAICADAPADIVEKSKLLGEYLGYAFQIKDDIFDYYKNEDLGKPTGNDIREGKVTLPLLYALQHAGPAELETYMMWLRSKEFTPVQVDQLIDFAIRKGGIEYAENRMRHYHSKAIELVDSYPDSDAKEALILLANYIIERKK
ncbi:MAG TPA: polyprenyl synthetase family protein [Macellibacteroides fermentans]|uniref:polyprenyl synthetase family protein n=1 Tax=Macellibacteroides fermentans TaxID=879969 RepID=UPI002C7B6F1B|nr:polyprenyl synthetase family protein [Macellibacteroides fermentans]